MKHAKTATLIGAAAALAAGPALAAPAASSPLPVATSYADLLTPVPNALEQLKLADAQDYGAPPQLIQAQYHHHHNQQPPHHHHNHHNRAWYVSHGYVWFNGAWVIRPKHHHHHHHQHN